MSPESNKPTQQPKPVRSIPWSFLMLVGSFIVPVLLAYALLQSGIWSERGTASNGVLIDPPADFDHLSLMSSQHQSFQRAANEQKKWWMVLVLPQDCQDACRHALYQIRQTYIATGADRHRVGTLVISVNTLTDELATLLSTDYPQTLVLQGNADQINDLLSPAQLSDQRASDSQQIYLVDPMGAIFMTYPAPQDEPQAIRQGKLMLKDLKRVLKLSRIG